MDDDLAAVLHVLEEARRRLAERGKVAASQAFDRVCAVQYAVELLRQKVERPAIRDRLRQKYGLGRTAAYESHRGIASAVLRPARQYSNCPPMADADSRD